MENLRDILQLLDDTLGLNGRSAGFSAATPLLGALPELDSMAVVNLINALEERFGIPVSDDDISAETFATVGSFADFVAQRAQA